MKKAALRKSAKPKAKTSSPSSVNADVILEQVRRHGDDIVEFTRELIAIPSENPPGNCYPESVDLLQRRLVELGFQPQRARDCLLCFVGRPGPTLYFSGHYDVVPAQSATQFKPEIKGKNLFGRGSSDMKGGLAAMIYAAKIIRDSGIELDGRIGIVLVPDEETAGPRGSRYLEKKGLLGRDAIGMLTPEPTGGLIWNANRGAITLEVTVTGKPAHVGRQFEGINAFEGMMAIVSDLAALKNEVERRATDYNIRPEKARHSILMLGGQSHGGTNFNIVPACCSFTIDRRINPEEDFGAEQRRLHSLLRSRPPWAVEVRTLQEAKAAGSPENTPLGIALRDSILQVVSATPRFELCPGLLETRFYASRGIPAYAYGPGLLTVSHGPNEFVPIGNLIQCAQVYALTALSMLK